MQIFIFKSKIPIFFNYEPYELMLLAVLHKHLILKYASNVFNPEEVALWRYPPGSVVC